MPTWSACCKDLEGSPCCVPGPERAFRGNGPGQALSEHMLPLLFCSFSITTPPAGTGSQEVLRSDSCVDWSSKRHIPTFPDAVEAVLGLCEGSGVGGAVG